MKKSKYVVEISGSSWSNGPKVDATTMREARKIAESYGNTADSATILTRSGRIVGAHRRNPDGDGRGWFKAQGGN